MKINNPRYAINKLLRNAGIKIDTILAINKATNPPNKIPLYFVKSTFVTWPMTAQLTNKIAANINAWNTVPTSYASGITPNVIPVIAAYVKNNAVHAPFDKCLTAAFRESTNTICVINNPIWINIADSLKKKIRANVPPVTREWKIRYATAAVIVKPIPMYVNTLVI